MTEGKGVERHLSGSSIPVELVLYFYLPAFLFEYSQNSLQCSALDSKRSQCSAGRKGAGMPVTMLE